MNTDTPTPRSDRILKIAGTLKDSVLSEIRELEADLAAARAELAQAKANNEIHWRTLRECADMLCLPDESPSLLPEKIRILQACHLSEKRAKVERGDMMLEAEAERDKLRAENAKLRDALVSFPAIHTEPEGKLGQWIISARAAIGAAMSAKSEKQLP